MIKLSHAMMIRISGAVWFLVGCFLLPLGLKLLIKSANEEGTFPLVDSLAPYCGGAQQAALLVIVVFLYIGYCKARFVLSKTVHRNISRIRSFPNPMNLSNLYGKGYYVLFAIMIGLGMSMRYFGLSDDVRGAVDVAVGSALINGAMAFFRASKEERKVSPISS